MSAATRSSRRQVLQRAPELCDDCALRDACPIGGYPGSVAGDMIDPAPTMSTEAFGPNVADGHESVAGLSDWRSR